jgi:hypothetical protein
MSGGVKGELTALERLDFFIQEQKKRRDAFWARHRERSMLFTSVDHLAQHKAKQKLQAAASKVEKDAIKHWNPTNCVELELHALKSISARSEAIQKLDSCCRKVDEYVYARGGFVVSSDPMLRLFFRLVENVREKTIDAVECIAAWERNVGRGKPFMHKYAHPTGSIPRNLRINAVQCCAEVHVSASESTPA